MRRQRMHHASWAASTAAFEDTGAFCACALSAHRTVLEYTLRWRAYVFYTMLLPEVTTFRPFDAAVLEIGST